MWQDRFIPTEHEALVSSSFTDYSEEKRKFLVDSLYNRAIGAVKSRYHYNVAESNVRKNYPIVAKAQELARQDGGLIGQYQWVRLWEIARFVKLFDVKTACEFGSGGGSTTMFSEVIPGKFVSLEENEKWYERTKECLPESANVELLRKDRLVIDYDGEPGTKYDLPEEFYKQQFDLVYVDGPTTRPLSKDEEKLPILDQTKKMMPNIDVEFFIENNCAPKVILVDAKRPTVRRLCQKYSDRYNIYLRYYYKDKQDRKGQFLYHTVMVHRN